MRIAIVGAGALGLYYGAMLQKGGNDVVFLLRRDYEAIVTKGLQVRSINGDFHLAEVRGYRSPEDIGPVDLVVVGLKTFANHLYGELITPLLGSGTMILTLQNGLGNEETLASLFGADRILGGVAFLCSNRGEPGVVEHLGAGRILLGAFAGEGGERVEGVAAMFRAASVECMAVSDLKRARWEKLVWNIPFNGICTLMAKPVDALLAHGKTRTLVRDVMLEVIAAANGQGLAEAISPSLADEMIAFSEPMGTYRPSMQIDREEGRQLELEAIFGKPLAAGLRGGIGMPKVEMLYALLELSEK